MCACVFVFESSNVSEILQPCFIQWEVRGSSTNSSPNVLNGLFWSDGCRASCSLHRRRHSAPHSPARLSQQPTISLPSHHQPHCHYGNCAHARIQSVLEVRRGYSTESRVKCCPNDLGQEQNKCEREASCLCIWVESWKLGVERRGSRPRHSTGRVWWITIRSINMLPLWYKAVRVKFKDDVVISIFPAIWHQQLYWRVLQLKRLYAARIIKIRDVYREHQKSFFLAKEPE